MARNLTRHNSKLDSLRIVPGFYEESGGERLRRRGNRLLSLPLALGVCDLLTGFLEDQGAEVEEVGVGGIERLAGAPHVLAVRPVNGVGARGLSPVDVVGRHDQERGHLEHPVHHRDAGAHQCVLLELESVDRAWKGAIGKEKGAKRQGGCWVQCQQERRGMEARSVELGLKAHP